MKKLIAIISMLIIVNYVEAESKGAGVISKVDLEKGYIAVNTVQYKIIKGKTKVFSGKHGLGLSLLKEGMDVKYLLDGIFLAEIRLIKPYEFDE